MTIADFDKLYSFSVNSGEIEFKELFGDGVGTHLWKKFTDDYKSNFMEFFYHGLHADSKKIIFDHVFK
ncbi:MAG: hypothetical protein V4635_09575 [Bacteroidota bacterium]